MTELQPLPTDEKPLIGPKICIMGMGGTGKTYCLGTLCDWAERNDFEVCILFTENSQETLLGYYRDRDKEIPSCVYWHQQGTKPISLKNLIQWAENTGKLSYEALANSKDPNRGGENNAFWKILLSISHFIDDRTGKDLGAVDHFPIQRVFVMDSLTETANAAFKMQIGGRPMASPGDYGVAQTNLINLLRLITQGCDCPFVMTAHADREQDEVAQTTKIMIKAIGKALASEIPTLFSEVIWAVRNGDKFTWDMAAYGVDVKTRSLGYRAGIAPDLGVLMDTWRKRSGV